MKRIVLSVVASAALIAVTVAHGATLVRNVRIVDGTGDPVREGAVRIEDGRIVAVGDLRPALGDEVIDGQGEVLAPGFIDSHSHLDHTMFADRGVPGAVSQGVTTIVIGQDGYSTEPIAVLAAKLGATPVAVNVGSYSGHNTLRTRVMGSSRQPASAAQVAAMAELLRADMAAGAFGLSTGLMYEPGAFSTVDEVRQLAAVAAAEGGRYISHVRDEGFGVFAAIDELIDIGAATGMPVQVSHLKIAVHKMWGQAPALLARLEKARAQGIDVTADVYPYTYWQTTMGVLFPAKDYSDRAGVAKNFAESVTPDALIISRFLPDPALQGRTIASIAAARNSDPVSTYIALMAQANDYRTKHPEAQRVEAVIGRSMSDADVADFITWPHSNVGSDGSDGGHPRGYGTFPRVIAEYVRKEQRLTLEQAIYKMTGLTARHLGIAGRGVIRPGAYADLVLFDPATIADRATIADGKALAVGVTSVWVNGVVVYSKGTISGAHPGRLIRAESYRSK